uniref:Phenoloxidase-activating factor 3 n=1 Tax=Holotrichia diomphalia TaxID=33394 RepID=PPAF3_HOLDI|nr:RecName: Full=Phenoloxidase-activating factor 3; AltName: Full=Prophenoloxidase-activating factor III; AltName: Full=Serine protease-like protein PPAF-3; Contains: RecName: Full=Phenoloxidase-activating factor 3 light chain; Contains: RecName: Full=Phenoloxidase-activating factor 3 heavy chain; Flags: Precursor [Holotrichia diomphalia]BAC15604.1 prophenoloxidase activating factor-III [Holotrichia diomphalia]
MWLSLVILGVASAIVNVSTQESCTTPNGETATCLPIESCKIFWDYVVTSGADPEINSFLRASLCRQGNYVVCCGSTLKFNSALPDRTECGLQDDFKVLGGEDTDLGEYPWMALLQQTKTSGAKSFGCGGSLISDRYVLTAAHCVVSSSYTVTMVRLGEWDLRATQDCVGSGSYQYCSPPPQDIGIESITSHPNYEKSSRGVFNDIALIRLARPVNRNKYVQPICLPLPTERTPVGENLLVAGWGATETKAQSDKKQKLKLPVTDLPACKTLYAKHNKIINDKMICAGGLKGKDSCKGDSGGPLFGQTGAGNAQFYIEGIVSYGAICGTEGFPAIYTRVSDHLDWIKQNVRV